MLIDDVGRRLVKDHGKKKHYQPAEVLRAAMDLGYRVDVVCWAYCIFLAPEAFEAIHRAMGEVCDYAAMRASTLAEISPIGSFLPGDMELERRIRAAQRKRLYGEEALGERRHKRVSGPC